MEIYNKLKKLYDNNINEYLTSNYKMGVCMATFKRKNGKTPEYLTKSLNSILSQTASNWHVYLVGDKYEDNDEFNKLASLIPKDKITTFNLPVALERDNLSGNNLWKQGGANAMNNANKLALDDNCDYILHLDDDDSFHPKKIQMINYILSVFNEPSFIFHYSTHSDGSILPREVIKDIKKNIIPVTIGNIIHSSFCIHKSILSNFKYSSFIPGKTDYICGDMEFINYLNKSLEDKKNYTIFLPFLLSYHDKEAETKVGGNMKKKSKKRNIKKYKKKNTKKRKYIKKGGGEKYTAIIIEPRKHKALEYVLKNFYDNLDKDKWNFIIFHGNLNKDYIENIIKKNNFNNMNMISLNKDNLSIGEYNKLLTSKEFYNNIPNETFLIFQTDSLINPKNKDKINNFLNYDYVGAPWNWNKHVGNGGLSLRKKTKMLEIIDKFTYDPKDPEDAYFNGYELDLNKILLNKPSYEEAQLFSSETVWNPNSFGIHSPWKYNDLNIIKKDFPELETLYNLQGSEN